MKRRQTIDKAKVIFYTVVIVIAALTIWVLLYKIKESIMIKEKEGIMIKEWENQVEEPNTAEDYASDEESEFIENSRDKFIYAGRIDAWPKRIYCFECAANGYAYRHETEELLPIRMEVGDLVKIEGGEEWDEMYEEGIITNIDSIKFVNEEVYISSIPEINRVDKDYIWQDTTRRVVDPYGNGGVEIGWPYDYIYYYYEETGEIIAYFKNFMFIDEASMIDKGDMADVHAYNYVKRDGEIYKYKYEYSFSKDGWDGNHYWYYTNIEIPEEKRDDVLKQQNEDIFFKYIIEP